MKISFDRSKLHLLVLFYYVWCFIVGLWFVSVLFLQISLAAANCFLIIIFQLFQIVLSRHKLHPRF